MACESYVQRFCSIRIYSQCPFSLMTSITESTYFSHSFSVSASTITRITGSVPLSRTRILPVLPSVSATCFTAACTSASFCASGLLFTRIFLSTCGLPCFRKHIYHQPVFFRNQYQVHQRLYKVRS